MGSKLEMAKTVNVSVSHFQMLSMTALTRHRCTTNAELEWLYEAVA